MLAREQTQSQQEESKHLNQVRLSISHDSDRRAIRQAKGELAHMAQQISWGQTTFILDQDRFLQGYHNGRRYYFEDSSPEEPSSVQISVSNLLRLIAMPDTQGCYQLDNGLERSAFREGVEELLGVLVGYLAGPLHAETSEEQQQRLAECVVLHETVAVS